MNPGATSMRLNRQDARWLGVCAGIADWLDVPAVLVRVVFIICVITWPPLILGYFCLYFCLDKDITPEKMQDYFRNAKTAEHFKQLDYRKPIYKNRRNKRIAGVCSGIADYLEVSAFSVRVVTLLSLFVFGPFTFWAYIICMFVFDDDPHADAYDHSERHSEKKRRREARREARQARRQARREGRRNSYVNEEFKVDMSDIEADIDDAVVKVQVELNKAMGRAKQARTKKGAKAGSARSSSGVSRQECTEQYNRLELRLREIEAYMTSKRFRLHCEINRI